MAAQIHRALTILRRKQVEARTGLARSTLYERIRAGAFPPPISLGAKAVGWLESDIQAWITSRVDISRSASRRGETPVEQIGPDVVSPETKRYVDQGEGAFGAGSDRTPAPSTGAAYPHRPAPTLQAARGEAK